MFDILGDILNFVIFGVVVKYVIAKWLAEKIMAGSKAWFAASDRNWAIWEHYQNRALGDGHNADSVLDCRQDKCVAFQP